MSRERGEKDCDGSHGKTMKEKWRNGEGNGKTKPRTEERQVEADTGKLRNKVKRPSHSFLFPIRYALSRWLFTQGHFSSYRLRPLSVLRVHQTGGAVSAFP